MNSVASPRSAGAWYVRPLGALPTVRRSDVASGARRVRGLCPEGERLPRRRARVSPGEAPPTWSRIDRHQHAPRVPRRRGRSDHARQRPLRQRRRRCAASRADAAPFHELHRARDHRAEGRSDGRARGHAHRDARQARRRAQGFRRLRAEEGRLRLRLRRHLRRRPDSNANRAAFESFVGGFHTLSETN